MNDNREYRQNGEAISTNSRHITGYGAVFDTPSTGLSWVETIAKGAITNDTIYNSDVFAKFNHDDNKILARSKNGEGSLKLSVDDYGLKYEFDAPNTALGDELLEYLRRGDITASSFCFVIAEDGDRWYKEGSTIKRTITKIEKLMDIAPVFEPAYDSTMCVQRYNDIKSKSEEINKMLDEIKFQIELL